MLLLLVMKKIIKEALGVRQQLVRLSYLNHLARMQDGNEISVGNGVEPVRDLNYCPPLRCRLKRLDTFPKKKLGSVFFLFQS